MRATWITAALAIGCGGDSSKVAFSSPVGIELHAKAHDVMNGAISDEKEINTENGNPYGAFVAAAQQHLGRAPSSIDVERATMTLGAGSRGVTDLSQVFTGTVSVLFQMNDTNDTFPVASVSSPSGGGPDDMSVSFVPPAGSAPDFTKLLTGSFKVAMRGTAATGFAAGDADARIQITLTFSASE